MAKVSETRKTTIDLRLKAAGWDISDQAQVVEEFFVSLFNSNLLREVVDIGQLNAELASTVSKIDRLRADIDVIVAEIEGGEA